MSRGAWIALAAATALIIVLTRELHAAARVWTAVLMVPLPALMLLQAQQLRSLDDIPRRAAYASSVFSLWLLAGATFGIAVYAGLPLPPLVTITPVRIALLTTALVAGCVALLFLFHRLGVQETQTLRALLPQSAADKLAFIGVSITAGICEEVIFRGFLQQALATATGSPWIALALASGSFGVVHAYQSPTGAVRAALIGVVLGVPVVLGFGLLPSILAHALVDVLAGIVLARWLLR
ncbi:MAG TPA: CPBP family intramembrane glutamic endopeptidase [Longimicrobiales bacterium]|nr:CPBP family intramembrane glutamic endopeptidase [Longimicrobiales bacterium]